MEYNIGEWLLIAAMGCVGLAFNIWFWIGLFNKWSDPDQ